MDLREIHLRNSGVPSLSRAWIIKMVIEMSMITIVTRPLMPSTYEEVSVLRRCYCIESTLTVNVSPDNVDKAELLKL